VQIKKHILVVLFLLLISLKGFSQDSLAVKVADTIITVSNEDIFNPLSPSKAAFYSAVLPGLGQAYNRSYWKIPIVYGALGTGIYFYSTNNTNFKRARTAYKLRINDKPDEFDGENGNPFLSVDALIAAQKGYKKDRDLSLLVTVGLYILQILEASTNAHLLQHNVDNNLTISPQFIKDTTTNKTIVGAGLNFKF
jgi:hypothetical protein